MDDKAKNKELQALISLLDEPDEDIFRTIRDRILPMGSMLFPSLKVYGKAL